jgi:hypothetical protein
MIANQYKELVKYRSDLFTLLSEACELEHGLACSYLYSSFSLKQNIDEGITPNELHYTKKWASKIFFIASQEMLHLAQVWNLLNAIGGSPYYFRPNFPQKSKYYPIHLPLKLEPFSYEALKRFILYELPSEINEKEFAKVNFGYTSEDDYSYKTVGELYSLIADGFQNINEKTLFIGNHDLQLGQEEIDFREIIKVTDRDSALEAIKLITHQGEGTKKDRDDCHHGIFLSIENEYKDILRSNPSFAPARNCLTNPITYLKGNYSSSYGEFIINDVTRELSDAFDDIYNLMLRSLQFSFSEINIIHRRITSKFAINLMIRTIKPLGEFLTTQPAFNNEFFKTAGATFALTRHIPFPNNYDVTIQVIKERSNEIYMRLNLLKKRIKNNYAFLEILKNYFDCIQI